jgi:predicted HD phosphohydrolase
VSAAVEFTAMAEATEADHALLQPLEQAFVDDLPDRLLVSFDRLASSFLGYQIDRRQHSLQSATRALRDGRDEEYVVTALLHDLGDELAPLCHGEMIAAVLRPYVREELCWIAKHHGLFQTYYYAHLRGGDRHGRDRLRDHQWFDACVDFCHHYDQNCFDPAYDTLPLEAFEPIVRRIFAEPRYLGPASLP